MFSFIELPQLGFSGREVASLYVNTRDIITLTEEYDGQTRIQVRGIGADHGAASLRTYVPLAVLLGELTIRAEEPGVSGWSNDSKAKWAAPIKALLAEQAERERAVR